LNLGPHAYQAEKAQLTDANGADL